MNFVHLIQQVAHTVNNDVVRPLDRLINPAGSPPNQIRTTSPTGGDLLNRGVNDVISAWQHVNPFSGLRNANELIGKTQQQYGLTPQFVQTLHNANTSLNNSNISLDATGALKGGVAGGITQEPNTAPWLINRVQVSGANAEGQAPTLIHEGLHQVFGANPQVKNAFLNAFNKGATPDLKNYIDSQLSQYKNYQGAQTLNDLSKASPDIQNEAHSFTGEYLASQHSNISKNSPLFKYYSQYFNPSKTQAQHSAYPSLPSNVDAHNIYGDKSGNLWIEGPTGTKYPLPKPSSTASVNVQSRNLLSFLKYF